ncbi:nucleolar protein,Nop52-domain-containing protein [Thelephora terrestris]|uniref:Nucleolar protein,Nop52-domain-containing protein n=1 Tax=Thelephora terrestris TaxID=56493 RepID=A0A9P6HIN5_9AGAM|nr:nucleolar protein,Nop52-domain-containing protein [Thelephora terrestris]
MLKLTNPKHRILRELSAHVCEEKATRDKAVKHLVQFLSEPARHVLSDDLEQAKLWKGVFYCFWMSDKLLVQQALASGLADILLKIHDRASLRSFDKAAVLAGVAALGITPEVALLREFVAYIPRSWVYGLPLETLISPPGSIPADAL